MAFVFPLLYSAISRFINLYFGFLVASDGHRLIHSGNSCTLQNSTRWKELVDIVKFQAGFAKAANAVTEFRLLNNAAPIVGKLMICS